jgi:2-methylcitrate dehydratase PrpD
VSGGPSGSSTSLSSLAAIAEFVVHSAPPAAARVRAATAVLDTVGVALAGSSEAVSHIVQTSLPRVEDGSPVWGARMRSTPTEAALANGTAAHALDYDDMCFVSLAHPSAPLVPAVLGAADVSHASGRAALDAYVVGFEIQARLGRAMNPRHYQRGWHCTSTLGTISAAAAASRLLRLSPTATAHAIAIAASAASGFKENFGSMVKPLHAGLAARAGLQAALFARQGMTASAQALDGPQGFLHVMDSERADLTSEVADLGSRWEILDTGITIKLYPSCAGTHPTLDALLDLRARERFTDADVDRIDVDVDAIVPTILIYDRPTSPLEGKFSLPFCAAAAVTFGRVGLDTFASECMRDPRVASLMPRVAMHVDPNLGRHAPPLTEARVHVRLKDGRTLTQEAHGARGYPDKPPSAAELDAKLLGCAILSMSTTAQDALAMLRRIEEVDDMHTLAELL